MRLGLARKAATSFFYIAVITLLVGAYAYNFPETFVRVPGDRDPSLVGDWYVERGNSFRHYTFKEDGTGEIYAPGREPRKFNWGTDEQHLRLKYQTQNGWSVPEYEFNSNSEGQVSMKELTSGYSMEMKKQPPQTALLQ